MSWRQHCSYLLRRAIITIVNNHKELRKQRQYELFSKEGAMIKM